MAKVHRHAVVPVFGRDLGDLVAVVVGGVVDQHLDRSEVGRDVFDNLAQGDDVRQITFDEFGAAGAGPGDLFDQGFGGLGRDIDEDHTRILLAEMLDDAGTDPRAAAGYENHFVFEAGIPRDRGHLMEPFQLFLCLLVGKFAQDNHAQNLILGHIGRPAGADPTAVFHDHDTIREIENVVDVMTDQEDADALPFQLLDQVGHHRGFVRAQGGRRLVHDQDLGIEIDGPGDRDRLPLARPTWS